MASGRVRSTRKLKQWMTEQVESGRYPGLIWDNPGKTMFRIPWKHAGKQDFRHDEDAAIFKAWAVFKNKYKKGDKTDPAAWKTRLRCALNKSPEFQVVSERSQLDISEPYKVYRIVPPAEQNIIPLPGQIGRTKSIKEEQRGTSSEEEMEAKPAFTLDLLNLGLKLESESDISSSVSLEDSGISSSANSPSNSESFTESISNMAVESQPAPGPYSMLITFYYGGQLVCTKTVQSNDCRILPGSPGTDMGQTMVPRTMQQVFMPSTITIADANKREAADKLLTFLEKGVMLASNSQGIFIQRSCQGRVFWTGPCAPLSGQSTKLDRDTLVKLFDSKQFLRDLDLCRTLAAPAPEYRVTLCFGEEFSAADPVTDKLISLQIEQVMAKQHMHELEELSTRAAALILSSAVPSTFLLYE
ncbi:interferon regulatory factor 9 [Rhinatrema bivittatum]|uniref:interferon regulatory factor 9 n=1 Tax=Rhinatrema bivittatum TaxID=194408 RepID=UPI00112C9CE5|nr:interferon regulatory factor 9 [Rhinatrema bivittatum]XP_029437843.1 interferon regulatory factor 9 [Rhinatrema bivittatum]